MVTTSTAGDTVPLFYSYRTLRSRDNLKARTLPLHKRLRHGIKAIGDGDCRINYKCCRDHIGSDWTPKKSWGLWKTINVSIFHDIEPPTWDVKQWLQAGVKILNCVQYAAMARAEAMQPLRHIRARHCNFPSVPMRSLSTAA